MALTVNLDHEVLRENIQYDLMEMLKGLNNVNSTLPKGMTLVGAKASSFCDRCELNGAIQTPEECYLVHFDNPLLFGDGKRNYAYFCAVCFDNAIEHEIMYQLALGV